MGMGIPIHMHTPNSVRPYVIFSCGDCISIDCYRLLLYLCVLTALLQPIDTTTAR